MSNMKYPLGTKVKFKEECYEDMDPYIDEDVFLDIVGTIIGYSERDEYPYLIEFSKDDWKSPFNSHCSIAGCTLNYNGSVFKEKEFYIVQAATDLKNYENMETNNEIDNEIAKFDAILKLEKNKTNLVLTPIVNEDNSLSKIKKRSKKANYMAYRLTI